MALTPQEQNRLLIYLLRGFAHVDTSVIIKALFDACFMSNTDRRNWFLGRIAAVKNATQNNLNTIDAQTATAKTAFNAEIADLTTIETNL